LVVLLELLQVFYLRLTVGKKTREKIISEIDETTNLTLDVNESLAQFKEALIVTKETAAELLPVFQSGIEKDIENFQFQAEPRIAKIQEQIDKLSDELTQLTDEFSETQESDNPTQRFHLNRPK
jgi:cell division protein FtsX